MIINQKLSRVLLTIFTFSCSTCACSTQNSIVVEEYVRPSWMAEKVQADEERISGHQACINTKGWDIIIDWEGGMDVSNLNDSEMERLSNDLHSCFDELGYTRDDSFPDEADLRLSYQRQLETRECLIANGIKVETVPPSEDVWVDEALKFWAAVQAGESPPVESGDSWSAYDDVINQGLYSEELVRICPQG